jgi:steroid 5-alpha reductase family enzyme
MSALVFAQAVIVIAVALSGMLAVAWALQQRTGTSSWIDCGWTLAVGLTGCAGALAPMGTDQAKSRQILVAALIALWTLRLAGHLLRRALRGGDDPRYAALTREWGKNAPRQMFWFAQAQAGAAVPLAVTVALAAHRPGLSLDSQDLFAMILVLISLSGAALSDWQLRSFARANRGGLGICEIGLWRWSRHPNYFFEWSGWLGFAAFAADLDGNYLFGWLGLLAPALMYWLLVHVSGIPLLEEHMLRSRGEAFARYMQRTSMFFPWPPSVARDAKP